MCANDHNTYTTTWSAINDEVCYPKCGLTAAWSNTCGCPNRCYSHLTPAQGQCLTTCVCSAGWGGPDCSSVKCPNACSGRGSCVAGTPENGGDHCVCSAQYTGADCSITRNNLHAAPWGDIFPDAGPYYADDPYGDNHPLFNINVVAQMRITISQADWDYLLTSETLYSQSYVSATLVFDNGVIPREVIPEVGIRLKGGWSRAYQKKGYSIVFDKFGHTGRTFYGARKIGIKGNVDGDGITRGQLYADFNRAAGVPTQRSSFATLHINDVYMGVYWLHEDIDVRFLQSRLGSNDGDLWKMAGVSLAWYGDSEDPYKEMGYTVPMGVWLPAIELAEGPGNWPNLINLFYFVERSPDSEFYDNLARRIDVYGFRRACLVETFMLAPDGYLQNGNNYYLYYNPSNDKWTMITHDFDASLEQDEERDYHRFLMERADRYPLTMRVYTNLPQMEQFRQNLMQFLLATFGPAAQSESPLMRYAAMATFITPLIARDELWRLSTWGSAEHFANKVQETLDFLPVRVAELWEQLGGKDKIDVAKLTGGKLNATHVTEWFAKLGRSAGVRGN